MYQAEIKPFKVGETVITAVIGNPEPSILDSSKRACVETRQKVCIKCGNVVPQTKYKNAKFCTTKCRGHYNTDKYKIKRGLLKAPGSGKGGNQWGTDNHRYKTGIGNYNRIALIHYKKVCNRCNSTEKLLVHHINENRNDNNLKNLEVLCKRCHQNHHCKRDIFGKYTKG